MSEEKKTAVTEEVKEGVRKLTEEELEQVSGGFMPDPYMPDEEIPAVP